LEGDTTLDLYIPSVNIFELAAQLIPGSIIPESTLPGLNIPLGVDNFAASMTFAGGGGFTFSASGDMVLFGVTGISLYFTILNDGGKTKMGLAIFMDLDELAGQMPAELDSFLSPFTAAVPFLYLTFASQEFTESEFTDGVALRKVINITIKITITIIITITNAVTVTIITRASDCTRGSGQIRRPTPRAPPPGIGKVLTATFTLTLTLALRLSLTLILTLTLTLTFVFTVTHTHAGGSIGDSFPAEGEAEPTSSRRRTLGSHIHIHAHSHR
jgi:hypothetical protein